MNEAVPFVWLFKSRHLIVLYSKRQKLRELFILGSVNTIPVEIK
jgi:hypothetical protein